MRKTGFWVYQNHDERVRIVAFQRVFQQVLSRGVSNAEAFMMAVLCTNDTEFNRNPEAFAKYDKEIQRDGGGKMMGTVMPALDFRRHILERREKKAYKVRF